MGQKKSKLQLKKYTFGAPAFGARRADFLDVLKKQHGVFSASDDHSHLDEFLNLIADRLTDKSAALLQTVSVFAGIFGLLIFSPDKAGAISGYIAMGLFVIAALLLARNLAMFWPKLEFGAAQTKVDAAPLSEKWRQALALVICQRAVRHTLALWLLVPAVAFATWSCSKPFREGAINALSVFSSEAFRCGAPWRHCIPAPAKPLPQPAVVEKKAAACPPNQGPIISPGTESKKESASDGSVSFKDQPPAPQQDLAPTAQKAANP